MAVSVKIDAGLEERLSRLAEVRQRTKHYLMKEAIERFVAAEEQREHLKNQTIAAYDDYLKTGQHLTGKEVVDFLRSEQSGTLPECHK